MPDTLSTLRDQAPENVRPPMLRIMWLPGSGFSAGDGSYYGWRWWVHIGPVLILMGHKMPEEP